MLMTSKKQFVLTIVASVLSTAPIHAQAVRSIDFNRDVRPILSDACFHCHGPDKAKRKASLGFDSEAAAMIDLGGYRAIVPGKPAESELVKRITTTDKTKRMPPTSSPHALTPKQIDTLTRWIAEGAKWQQHWAFLPPVRSPLPAVKNNNWPRNVIDHFVLARLEAEGLTPSLEADPVTLIRRLSLDLNGVPPTLREIDDFRSRIADWRSKASALPNRPSTIPQQAVEELVDRLLVSPRFGERMAQRWLDAARYADTNGYQTDGERTMWRWRDWVIDALNSNMPFDRFTIEQIAGDMLPNPTLEQRIATGFNRNHRGNSEGGVIPEEYAAEYVVDRVDTTSTVWLGLSVGCAKCHNHKYDPISQKEFYQLFAYFNNVPERGKAIKYGNSPPFIKAPTPEQTKRLQYLTSALREKEQAFRKFTGELASAQAAWEKTIVGLEQIDWAYSRDLHRHFPWTRIFDGARYFDAGDVARFGFFDKFTVGAWISPTGKKGGTIVSRMADTDRADGYRFSLKDGKLHLDLVKRWLDDAIRVETVEALPTNSWRHVAFSYDGSRLASGVKIFIDGKAAKLKVNLDDLNQSFNTEEPFRVAGGGGKDSRFVGSIAHVRVYNHVLADQDVASLGNADPIERIVHTTPAKRSPAQTHKLASYYLDQLALRAIRKAYDEMLAARADLERFDESIPTTMVMQEMPTSRDTHILLRGEYDKRGPKVQPGVPTAFAPLPKDAPNNRLGFARWLVSPDNPLTARVAVNRHWQMLFGTGIVKTVEDFGSQGDWPSHPELLDWLAVEFMSANGAWDTKRLLKLITISATYRQSSRVTPMLLQRDPDNRLLARGPRFRLSADVIRDQALAVSGLLVEKRGGPSVKPYQPEGLAKELTGTEDYVQDRGESLYRRSLYVFWKRTIAPPTLTNFDAANRETCVVRESRTNTPLQALNLMNDVTFVEAARVLAQRVMKTEKTPALRLALAWRLATARAPSEVEAKIMQAALESHLAHYRNNRVAATKLASTGESPRDGSLDVAEHAAYTAVCNLVLNLDEVITKE
ncbi:MAG: DUF1553 domain-containing protein [Gemmataceae bacterium]|nr:DUF1553 domain-containing protein [Gemmataceae bacterium]